MVPGGWRKLANLGMLVSEIIRPDHVLGWLDVIWPMMQGDDGVALNGRWLATAT